MSFENLGGWAPLAATALFLLASAVMIWRLEVLSESGFEGTILGALIMPYCSGMGNLAFVFVVLNQNGKGEDIIVNCMVNNVTNITLLLGLPALLGVLAVIPRKQARSKKARREHQLTRLNVLLTLVAAGFFTGIVWLLAMDGKLDRADGLTLVALFLFWQCYCVFEVLRGHVNDKHRLSVFYILEFAVLLVSACLQYVSVDYLVAWIAQADIGFIRAENLGWLTGWLMVVPNALLAVYYAARNRPDIVYSSQIGDGHICIPLCIGIFAAIREIETPALLGTGAVILAAVLALHGAFVILIGRIPRWAGLLLLAAYTAFCIKGLT